jgi:hypothetical protein
MVMMNDITGDGRYTVGLPTASRDDRSALEKAESLAPIGVVPALSNTLQNPFLARASSVKK